MILTATPRKEQDNEKFKCSSFIKTPASISMDSFLSATANASVKPGKRLVFNSLELKILEDLFRKVVLY